ncbi:MAG: hypothetical protein AB8C13_08030 [Phycisphaerales bacterium]
MTDATHQHAPEQQLTPVRLPILKMAGLSVLASTMIGIAGGALASNRGGVMTDGLLTIAVMLPGILVTLMALNFLPARPAGTWGIPVLAGTMFRAGMVLVIGFGAYLVVEPVKEVFVMTLLCSVLVVLTIDVLSVLSLVRSAEPAGYQHAPEAQA